MAAIGARYTHQRSYYRLSGVYYSHIFQNENGSYSGEIWGGHGNSITFEYRTTEHDNREDAQSDISENIPS